MKNIMINSRFLSNTRTGIGNYIENLYKNILRLDPDNRYCFLQYSPGENDFASTQYFSNRPLYSRVLSILFDLILVKRLFNPVSASVFHSAHGILPYYLSKKIKKVITIYDLIFLKFTGIYTFYFRWTYYYCLLYAARNSDAIITISESSKRDIMEYFGVPAQKIKVLYAGCDDFFHKTNSANFPIINLPVGKKFIFSVTPHCRRKNILPVINAFSNSAYINANYYYIITGSLKDKNIGELQDYAKKINMHERILFPGFLTKEELRWLYSNAELFIYPSLYEGFGIPILEAFACECMVACSNTSSLPEVVADAGVLFDPESVNDITNKIEYMLKLDEKTKMEYRKRGLSQKNKFSWEKIASEYIKIFNGNS